MSRRSLFLSTLLLTSAATAFSQSSPRTASQIVQPGAPGQPSRVLPPSTTGVPLPPPSAADTDFMQGMIMHHQQAVVMTSWIPTHTHNPEILELGRRISISQTDEMGYMRRWLQARGLAVPEPHGSMNMGHNRKTMDMSSMAMMPGMLTPAQMETLRNSTGAKFDHLFLTGMIQHHNGALIMVDQLFATPGAGQDADLFNFATDVSNTQKAQIRIMQGLLKKQKQ